MIEATRGATVQFYDCQFRDVDKNPTVPEAALLRVRYQKCGCSVCEDIEMVETDGLWSAEWDSSEADAGTVYWFIQSTLPERIAAQGEFRLRANPANTGCNGC